MRILYVEDERELSDVVCSGLRKCSYAVDAVFDGLEALEYYSAYEYDVIVLDLSLPGLDGLEVLRRIRQSDYRTKIMILSARSAVDDRVKGLNMGANDYLTKPFALEELEARVRALLRRSGAAGQRQAGQGALTVGHIRLDPSERSAWKDGKPVDLTAKEFDLLVLFVQNKNVALCRDRIFERVWNEEYLGDSRTVDLHVQRMRKKLGLEERLTAVYKVGYRLGG